MLIIIAGVTMDPSFLFTVANLLRDRQMAETAGRQTAFELERQQEKEEILNNRKEILNSFKERSNAVLTRSSNYPAYALLHANLMSDYLMATAVVPDSFPEEKDKEQSVLLHKKLANLTKKCLPMVTEEERAEIESCLAVNHKTHYLQYIFPKVVAREKLLGIDRKFRTNRWRSIFVWTLFCFWALFSGYVSFILGVTVIKIEDDLLLLLAVFGIIFGMIGLILPILYRLYPKDILKTKKLREQTIPLAEFNNRVLWQEIQENYPVIPSSEQLRKEYEELCQTVDSTVQKYSPLNEEPPEP